MLATLIATVAGTAAAIGFSKMRRRSRNLLLTVNNIPLTNADIITGVSMMLLFVFAGQALSGLSDWLNHTQWAESANLWFDFGFSLGFPTLLIAHVTFDIPYVILSVMPKIRQLDPNLAEAAQDLGATPLHRLPQGGAAGADARHRQRNADRLYHECGRLRHQLFHCRQSGVHIVHGGLLHGPPKGEPRRSTHCPR